MKKTDKIYEFLNDVPSIENKEAISKKEYWKGIKNALNKSRVTYDEERYMNIIRGLHFPRRACLKNRAKEIIVMCVKYELDTGKKIIPEYIEVPEELYEIAKEIDLDL